MPGLRITQYGMIRGGVCDQLHHARSDREAGAMMVFELAETAGCIVPIKKSKSVRFKKPFHLGWKRVASMGNAEFQNGVFRGEDLIAALQEKTLPYKSVLLLIDTVMSKQFGVSANADLGDLIRAAGALAKGKKTAVFGLAPAHQPRMFAERRKRGELTVPAWNPF